MVELVDWEGAAWIFSRLLTTAFMRALLAINSLKFRVLVWPSTGKAEWRRRSPAPQTLEVSCSYRPMGRRGSGDIEGRVEEDWRANTVSSASQIGGF